jgi:hypothetical protein
VDQAAECLCHFGSFFLKYLHGLLIHYLPHIPIFVVISPNTNFLAIELFSQITIPHRLIEIIDR